MICRFKRKRHVNKNCIWMIFLLFFLETAVLSGRMQMATFLPCAVERQTTRAAIRSVRAGSPVAALSSATRDGEAVSQAWTREQRISQQSAAGICIPICGVSLFCFSQILRRLLYRLSDNKSHRRSNFTISYIYNLSHL